MVRGNPLPPETLLYVPLTATARAAKGRSLNAAEVLTQFWQLLPDGKTGCNWAATKPPAWAGAAGIASTTAEQGA